MVAFYLQDEPETETPTVKEGDEGVSPEVPKEEEESSEEDSSKEEEDEDEEDDE